MDAFRDVCQTKSQQRFYLGLSVFLQAAIFIYSAVIAGIGLHILLVVTDKIGPILDEDAEHISVGISMELLSGFIVGIGFCNAFVCSSCPYIIYAIFNLENNQLHKKKIFTLVISQVILGFGVLFLGILCLLQRSRLDGNLQAAIVSSLPYYRSRMELKTSLDKMQIYYQCCGGKSPSDWFAIEWYRKISTEHKLGNTAPFSCCNRFAMAPCLSPTDITVLNIVFKSPLRAIWYKQGCAEAINQRLSHALLFPMGVISLIFFGLQLFGTCVTYLILSLLNEEKPKQKFQKLHFDIENFDHDNCDLNQHTCESSSSLEDDTSVFRRVVLQSPHYDRFCPYTSTNEKQEKKATEKSRKNPSVRQTKEKDRKVNKKGDKSMNKEERDMDDIAGVEVPITAPIFCNDQKEDENSDTNTELKDIPADYGPNEASPKNIVNDIEVLSDGGGHNKAGTINENTGTVLNVEEKESENDASEIHAMDDIRGVVEPLQIVDDIDDNIMTNEELENEPLFDLRGIRDSFSRLSVDST